MPTKAPKRDVVDSAALRAGAEAVAFGAFRIDRRASQLFDGDRAVPLRPKTWAVLLYLAERPKVLVTRDELLDALWPDVAVTPDTLNKSIGELRLALGDDSRRPRFLETVHRRGFRFIASGAAANAPTPRAAAALALVPAADVREKAPACFVGRDAEMQFLADRFAAAQAGDRQIVFITGPAGVGKTALVDAFLASRAIGERAVPVWIGRAGCVEQHGPREPYMPVLDALQRLVRPPNVERMIALMRRSAPLWLAQMPWLLGEADAAAHRQSLQGIRPERMPREMAALVETLTTDLTLVLVLEDLHWSDPSTVDLLTVLAQRRDRARLLVIATYRSADVAVHEHVLGAAVRTLQERDRCVQLALPDLTLDAVRGYLDLRFRDHTFPPALAERIHALTDGQPLFVVALVDHLRSRGSLLDTTPGWALSVPIDTVDLGVPDDVRRLIAGQFRALGPDERRVLEAASAAGEHIAASIIAAAVGCSVEVAEQHCEALARSQCFLHVVGTLAWPDRTRARRYAFTHELHRQVVYSETPDERRIRLHGAIGRALERAQGTSVNDLAPQLAVHFARAHDETRTLHYLTVAGARARERFASREALEYFDRALALIEELADPEERNFRETELRLARGRALGDLQGFGAEPVRENYERVSNLCAAADNGAQAFEALYARWYLHALRAERAPTLALADELGVVAGRLGNPGYVALAQSALVRTAYYDARFTDAVRAMTSLRRTLADHPSVRMPVAYGVDPVLAATTHCAGAVWYLGDAEGARAMAREAVAHARVSGNPFFLSAILAQAAQLDVMIGHNVTGGELAAEAEDLAGAQGFVLWHTVAAVLKTRAQAQEGEPGVGSGDIERAITAIRATGTRLTLDLFQCFLAEAHLRAGDRAHGIAAVEAGLDGIGTSLSRAHEPELWRLKGELLLMPAAPSRRGRRPARDADWPEAERCLRHAVELARAAESKSLELRASASLAQAWHARGRTGDARAILTPICERFDAGARAPDLVAARALNSRLTAAR